MFPKKNALFRQQFPYKLATVFAEHSRHMLHVMRNAAKHSLTMGPVNRFQNILPLKYFLTLNFLDKNFLKIVLLKKNFLNHIFVFITQLVIVASPSTHNDAFYAPFFEILRSLRVKRSLWSSSDAPNTSAQNCKNLICLCCEIVSIWGNIEARLLPVPLLSFMLANSLLPRSKQTALKKRD